jgi:hypothetical protein
VFGISYKGVEIMSRVKLGLLISISFVTLLNAKISLGAYLPVDFSASHNITVQRNQHFPHGGTFNLGGVPFTIPDGEINGWGSGNGIGGSYGNDGQWILDIDVGIFGTTDVYTLINTDWGTTAGGRMLVEFFGSDGAYYQKDLLGNTDIRDWNLYFTDTINNTTTTNVVSISPGTSGSPDVMDMQHFVLPSDFSNEILTHIRITDNRTTLVHSGLVSGVTVKTIPLPAAFWLFGSAITFFAQIKRRKIK